MHITVKSKLLPQKGQSLNLPLTMPSVTDNVQSRHTNVESVNLIYLKSSVWLNCKTLKDTRIAPGTNWHLVNIFDINKWPYQKYYITFFTLFTCKTKPNKNVRPKIKPFLVAYPSLLSSRRNFGLFGCTSWGSPWAGLSKQKGSLQKRRKPRNPGSFLPDFLCTCPPVPSLIVGWLSLLPLYVSGLLGHPLCRNRGFDWSCMGHDSVVDGAGSCSRNMVIPRGGAGQTTQ